MDVPSEIYLYIHLKFLGISLYCCKGVKTHSKHLIESNRTKYDKLGNIIISVTVELKDLLGSPVVQFF